MVPVDENVISFELELSEKVANSEVRDEIPYDRDPQTPFQEFIRLRKDGSSTKSKKLVLYDHHPLNLNTDDYQRVCRVPKKKGANFRDFPGLIIGPDNVVSLVEETERELLESGNPLVPDYALKYVRGTSSKPFGRLWWDETVPTVVTRAEPHNQRLLSSLMKEKTKQKPLRVSKTLTNVECFISLQEKDKPEICKYFLEEFKLDVTNKVS